MKGSNSPSLVMSVYATTRGFAFALFESPLSPVDWGVKEIPGPKKNARCLESVTKLIEAYRPDVVVIENCTAPDSRRSSRIRSLYRSIEALATRHAIETRSYSRDEVREAFGKFGAVTKEQIAEVIAKHLPEFEHRQPPVRRPWMSEDSRMGLFDATAFIFTFFNLGAGAQ